MTQGLQFSVLFSSADNMLSIDATAVNLSQTSPELQQQAERFRQVLASEQADGAVRQDVAAVTQDLEHGVNHQAKPAMPGKDTQLSKAANESADTNTQPTASDESSNVTDAAGELLGLIQRANLTASQLQKKADTAAEQHHIVPQPQLDKAEPVEDELSVIRDTALPVASDKDLTAHAGNKEDDTKLKAVTPVLSEDSITSVPNPAVTTANNERMAPGSVQAQSQPVTLADTQLPDDGLTPVPGTEQSEVISEAMAKAQQIKTEQTLASSAKSDAKSSAQSESDDTKFTQTAIAHSATETVKPFRDNEKRPSVQVSNTDKAAPDDASASILESEPGVSEAATNLTLASSPNERSEIKQYEALSLRTEAMLAKVSSSTDVLTQPIHTVLSAAEIAGRGFTGNTIFEGEKSATDSLSTAQIAVQTDAVARSGLGKADTSANQESKISQQPANMASSNDVLKIDTNAKSTGDERGAEQGTEQRLFQPGRLEVTLASGSSGQGSTQSESFQQQLARLDASVASVVAAQRASEKTPVPELSARLKHLNLQQQDAAGQLRERVQLMVRQNIQVAEIRLDPAELGQMQIRINLQQEQASVQFIVQQQHAKELLEQQMPRLRELLQQQGIQLGEGQVQQHSRQQQGNGDGSQRQTQTANQPADGFSDDLPAASTVEVQHRERLVDYYA
ncbi:MAG: flagellar hook-length control protein FliK [Alishewanella agri]|nr:flagellar hook-length control protein FliK [Alishewanella agri]